MNAIIQHQIGVTTMTPRYVDDVRRGVSSTNPRTLEALAAIPPATDEEAGEPTLPPLGLLQADIDHIHSLADAYRAAHMAAVEAEQTLAGARRVAMRLEEHRRDAGEIAARGYSGRMNGHGKAEAAAIAEKIDTARNAEAALPSLERDKEAVAATAGHARAALHRAITAALRGALARASARYSHHVLELTRCLASIEAVVGVMPTSVAAPMQAGLGHFNYRLSVPALPSAELGVPADRASIDSRFVAMLLDADHDRHTKHRVAADGWLRQQLHEALGEISPRTLLG